ncbi:type IV secretory system conjugative DNA transfer family protein [Asticcacaulis excentricus]|uniref:TRAG family protein n=1 Tax=Asticcacaulis excentricus (strain ATCC 15261 / DSM 4724 / KCTC 12464 / NCIMB 9791 / VKM B-1370 / CB 48) TaxID=573065 RepID=E8RQW4_ASTEC|nr:type IV secretory system conjugative DNA transfer family protein [Asticcacaulis excentricus]ADU12227.1 TRAG family protein [Asticcacaulis excentricus CB 48]
MISSVLRVLRALRKGLVRAVRDPLGAFLWVVGAPVRVWKPVLYALVVSVVILILLALLSEWVEGRLALIGIGGKPLKRVLDLIVVGIVVAVLWRLLVKPLLDHLGDGDGSDTHGSARFAEKREMAAVTRGHEGLLIGRDRSTRKLIRYSGPAHLLTLAPKRSGKGVGTVIPNLLVQNRSVICVDPKGENTRITARARSAFGPVYILDPFGVTGLPSASFNPLAALDPDSPDIAEDAALLADALVCDAPGTAGEAHWNEEAKALITGIILYIATEEFGHRRSLATLREYLTLNVPEFADLLDRMQETDACHGLIRRAANRHRSKADREAAGVLSSAQRHTHFLDSPRMTEVMIGSDFAFGDLKQSVATVYLVLPPDRLDTYARWLRLLVTQSLTELVRAKRPLPSPVLYLLDEFASLGYLSFVERAMSLMAGYGVQLWPILQDIHQLRALYGQRAGTFLSNAGVLQVFGVNDYETSRLVSDLLGQETVVFQSTGRNMDSNKSGLSYSEHHTGRPLLTPDEVRQMPPDTQLLFLNGQRPIVATRLRYYADPELRGLFDAG